MKLFNNNNARAPISLNIARAILDSEVFAFAITDQFFNILEISANFKALLAPETDSVVGLPLQEALWEFMGTESELTAVLHDQRPKFQLQHINRTLPDGSTGYLNFEITKQRLNNQQAGLFLLIQDQTELGVAHQQLTQQKNTLYLLRNEIDKTNQTLTQTLNIKEVFLSMAAHDMRNPLSAIMGYASLLLSANGVQEPQARDEMLHSIIEQSKHLDFLINDLVTVDKLNNGQLHLQIKPSDVGDILTKTIEALGSNIQKKDLIVRLILPPSPLVIPVDPQRFWQVSYNLLSNSVKYTPDGGVIEIKAYTTDEHLIVQISDNGMGISQENIARLFNLHYRTANAKQSKISGAGIGLYIVKTIVEAHKGDIFVESYLGKGSTFTIELPK
ncbi:MAG: HAMP domain-containing sensor histidine kinase [Chloroflexota bacterium]